MTLDDDNASALPDADVSATDATAGRSPVRGGLLRVVGYFIGVVVSTLSAAVLFRHLGVVTTGHYVTALSLVAIVAAISDLGLTAVGVREIATTEESKRWQLASDLLGLKLTLTLIGGVAVTLIAWTAYSSELAFGVALGIMGLALNTTQDNYTIPLVIELRFGWISVLDLLRNLLTAGLTLSFVAIGEKFLPFLAISIPVGAVLMVMTAAIIRARRSLRPSFNIRRWRGFMGKMLPYAAGVAASALYYRFSILLVSAFSSSRQLGYFSASYRIIEVLTTVPLLLVSTAFPILARAAHDDAERFAEAMRKVFEVSLIAGAWVAAALAVAAPFAISIIGGPSFKPAADVLAFQGLGLGATFINVTWAYGLLSLGRYRAILAINASALVINVAIVIPLVLADGARGAAIGTAITEIMAAVAQGLIFARVQTQFHISRNVISRVLGAAAVSLVPLALPVIPVLGRLSLSSAIFIVLLLVLKAVPREILELLPFERQGTHVVVRRSTK